jgi:hypothetical protein
MRDMIQTSIIFIFTGFFSIWASTTPPSGSLIESHESSASSSYIGKYSGNQLKQGQQFYLDDTDSQPVSGIGILLKSTDYGSPTGDITLAIYDNGGGNIPGNLVSGSTRSFTPVLGQWNYITFLPAGIPLNTGSTNKYWIVATVPEQSGDNDAYCWHRSSSNTYGRGYRKTYNLGGSGTWSGSQTGDFAFRIYGDVSLPVMLSSLFAVSSPTEVIISWKTESEVDILGFHVLRSKSKEFDYSRITTSLIPSQCNCSTGNEYEFIDKNIQNGVKYWYKIEEISTNGDTEVVGPVVVLSEKNILQGNEYQLINNYPNPFNPLTTIRYAVYGKRSEYRLILKIYNLICQEVLTLVDAYHDPGEYSIEWDGCDSFGRQVSSGIYLYQLSIGEQLIDMRKMLKMK